MSDHFIGINRGSPGVNDSDFTYGTSTGSTDIELRIADGASLTTKDVMLALEAFMRKLVTHDVHLTGTQFPPNT